MDLAPPDWRPDSVYVQAGASTRDAGVAGVGLRWGWAWQPRRWGSAWHGALDLTLSDWSAPLTRGGSERKHTTHWTLVPMVRWQSREAASPWFAEAGLGASLHLHRYRVAGLVQGSRWNFQEVLAFGRHLGDGSGEVSLRLAHLSNAGLRQPNPGETWLALRWSLSF